MVLLQDGPPDVQGSRLLQRWDLSNEGIWDSQADPEQSEYQRFKRDVAEKGGDTDPARILAASPTRNNRLVLANSGTWIRPASCLEKLLTAKQNSRIKVFLTPTEFASASLVSPDKRTLRIYFLTVNRNGIGPANPLTDPVRADVKAGWSLSFVLHNHPFAPGNNRINGITAPSVPDADFQYNLHRSLGLPEARITNGVDTVRIPASAFQLFQMKGSDVAR